MEATLPVTMYSSPSRCRGSVKRRNRSVGSVASEEEGISHLSCDLGLGPGRVSGPNGRRFQGSSRVVEAKCCPQLLLRGHSLEELCLQGLGVPARFVHGWTVARRGGGAFC